LKRKLVFSPPREISLRYLYIAGLVGQGGGEDKPDDKHCAAGRGLFVWPAATAIANQTEGEIALSTGERGESTNNDIWGKISDAIQW
jgi:hypothetical protein